MNWMLIVSCTACVIALISIIVVFIQSNRIRGLQQDVDNLPRTVTGGGSAKVDTSKFFTKTDWESYCESNLSRDIIARIKSSDSRLRKEIVSIVKIEMSSMKLSSGSSNQQPINVNSIIEMAAEKATDRATDWILDELRKGHIQQPQMVSQSQFENKPQVEELPKRDSETEQESQQKGKGKTYYATAVDEDDNKSFCNVTDEFKRGESVFKFYEEKPGRCSFEICEEAYAMVLRESEYLKGACSLNRVGSTRVITKERGIALFNEDANKWIVSEMAKVNFE